MGIDIPKLKREIKEVEEARKSGWAAKISAELLRRRTEALDKILEETRPNRSAFWSKHYEIVKPIDEQRTAHEYRYSTERIQLLYTLLSHTRGKLHRINEKVHANDGSGRLVTVPITMEEQAMRISLIELYFTK